MASRRTPLSNIPNAGNSPFRGNPIKRARSQANVTQGAENAVSQPPPSKRQAIEADSTAPITPQKARRDQTPVTPTQRQHAPRTREVIRTQKQEHFGESMEKLRQWQKHNEKAFPTYVFFFENVPENARRDCLRGIRALGSREATFFSREVTHVVTTRAIPAEGGQNPSADLAPTSTSPQQHDKMQTRTIDPSVLEKDRSVDALASLPKSKFTFEAPRRHLASALDCETRNNHPPDILLRAKNMGMKIWGLDKLNRILDVMFDDTAPGNPSVIRGKISNAVSKAPQSKPQDLQQLISNEQLNGPTDRDAKGVYSEMTTFKGPYIYVRCCFERVRPIMVREWPKVANREDGEWPQFRSVSSGKCPFVEEDPRARKAPSKAERENARNAAKEARRPKPSTEATQMQPPAVVGRKRPLAEVEGNSKAQPPGRQQLPPQCKDDGATPQPSMSQPNVFPTRSALLGGEPMASGMQASNITSAIRSQVISSTAAAPGAKAGTSREIHGLQRKVLARAHGPSGTGLSRSNGMTNLAGAMDPVGTGLGTRAAKQRAQERLGLSRLAQVLENPVEGDEDEAETERVESKTKATGGSAVRRKAAGREKRDPKPGFCENCREKFDDFEEHTLSKRHRKFAATKENWAELDQLLELLERPQLRGAH